MPEDHLALLTVFSPGDYGNSGEGQTVFFDSAGIAPVRFEGEIGVNGISDADTGFVREGSYPRETRCIVSAGNVYCWGNNTFGQLGNGTEVTAASPVKVSNATGLPQGQVTQVIVGSGFACALAAGKVYCWGKGTEYQLGNGGTNSSLPVRVEGDLSGVQVDEIAGDTDRILDISYVVARVGGELFHWGSIADRRDTTNTYLPIRHDYVSPTRIGGTFSSLSVTRISVDGALVYAVAGGRVFLWGRGEAISYGSGAANSPLPIEAQSPLEANSANGQTPLTGVEDFAGSFYTGVGVVAGRLVGAGVSIQVPSNAPLFKRVFSAAGGTPSIGIANGPYSAIGVDGTLWSTDYSRTLHLVADVSAVKKVTYASNGSSTDSNVMIVGATRPGRPSDLTMQSIDRTSVRVNWKAPTFNGGSPITNYTLRTYVGDAIDPSFTKVVAGTETSTVVTGLTAGVGYRFTLDAINAVSASYKTTWSEIAVPGVVAPPTPDEGISINNGAAYTNSKAVSLNLSWPANAVTARVSNDGGFRGASVQSFDIADGIKWNLDDSVVGTYTKVAYVRFIGYGVDSSKTYSDDIILDTAAPEITSLKTQAATGAAEISTASLNSVGAGDSTFSLASVRQPSGFAAAPKPVTKLFKLTLSARDKLSGVKSFAVSRYANGSKAITAKYKSSYKVKTLKTVKKIYIRVQDGAGNWSKWKAVTVR